MNKKILIGVAVFSLFFIFASLIIAEEPSCATDIGLCNDNESQCLDAGGYWCEQSVYDDEEDEFVIHSYCSSNQCPAPVVDGCSSSYLSRCNSELECDGAGGNWCETLNFNQSGYFVQGSCVSQCLSQCNSEVVTGCVTKEKCESVGGNWNEYLDRLYVEGEYVGDYLRANCNLVGGGCSNESLFWCRAKTSCEDSGGNWYTKTTIEDGEESNFSRCVSCGVESITKYLSCETEDMCLNAAGGEWCEFEILGTDSETNLMKIFNVDRCVNPDNGCPSCESDPNYCVREPDCTNVGANWCEDKYAEDDENVYQQFRCQKVDCRNCAVETPWSCNNSFSCESVGGEWCHIEDAAYNIGYNEFCADKCPVCNELTPWNCKSEETCVSKGLYWYEFDYYDNRIIGTHSSCYSEEPKICSLDNFENCLIQNDCSSVGGDWCEKESLDENGTIVISGECLSSDFNCPSCESDLNYCLRESDCTAVGGNWCDYVYLDLNQTFQVENYCSPVECVGCSSNDLYSCVSEGECESVGGNWCEEKTTFLDGRIESSNNCLSECPVCNELTPWNCDTQLECENTGGVWKIEAVPGTKDFFLRCVATNDCFDSDGGINIFTKGYIEVNGRRSDDECNPTPITTENDLLEYHCTPDDPNNGSAEGRIYNCEEGCEDGACIGEIDCNDPGVCELEDHPLCRECEYPEGWVCNHDEVCDLDEPARICDDCISITTPDNYIETPTNCQTSFNIATIYVYEEDLGLSACAGNYTDTNLSLSNERLEKIAKLGNQYSSKFGRNYANFTFEEDIALMEINPENKIVFITDSTRLDWRNVSVSVTHVNLENVIKEFYKTHPDNYDFINIYTSFPYACINQFNLTSSQYIQKDYVLRANFHIRTLSKVKNYRGYEQDEYYSYAVHGKQKRLLGFNLLDQLPFKFSDEPMEEFGEDKIVCISLHGIFHETSHQWGAYVGDSHKSGGELPLLTPDKIHWAPGLNTGQDSLGGNNWKDNGDGTFTVLPSDEFCAERTNLMINRFYVPKYSELALYLMGAISKEEVDPILLVDWKTPPYIGDTVTANSTYIDIEDIVARYGEVSCFEPQWYV